MTRLAFCTTFFLFLGQSLLPVAQAAESAVPDYIAMAQGIVDEYKARRSECAQAEDQTDKSLCYYRLRIKNWDYQEAKKMLDDYNATPPMVAHQ